MLLVRYRIGKCLWLHEKVCVHAVYHDARADIANIVDFLCGSGDIAYWNVFDDVLLIFFALIVPAPATRKAHPPSELSRTNIYISGLKVGSSARF
jgi:hypothetical protein